MTGNGLKLRKPEVFREIGYHPHGIQQEVHGSSARIRVLACGVRFGKTTCAAAEVVAALLAPCKQSIGWVVGPNLEVTTRVLERVRMAFYEHFPRRIELDREREHRFVVRNLGGGQSEVRGKSADARPSLLGAELDWLVMDECSKVKRAVWEEHLSARLLDRGGWALFVSTPGELDWFAELFRRGQAGTDPNCRSWRAATWDNPHVSRELIEQEQSRLPQEIFDQQYGGRFVLEAPEPCACCGFPSATAPSWVLVCTVDQFVYCRTCRNLVDRKGRTAVQRRADGTMLVCGLATGVPGEEEFAAEELERAASAGTVPAAD